MSSVDERIVEMRFDNQQFESGVQKSLRTLDRLKSGLNLENSAKSLESLQASANSFDLSGIASGVDAVSNRVSALGIVGDQVIRYLTNQFIELGEAAARVYKSLTADQIGVGFDKYERKVQSVQTIMNATGKDIDFVNDRINKLNWFTDETSYSLTDMIDNISKFTSSGVDLDVAVTSMIGIADAAGLAGASVSDASHAMEGFSKAIAQGYMSRQNWQWVRTAHMDTMQFKEVMIDAAVAAGTLIESVDADGMKSYATATGNAAVSVADFETALHEGWLTTNVMNEALHAFGGATEEIYKEYLETEQLTSDIIDRMDGQLDELGLKAFRASQEAKTFSDAINAVKDAVSTGWMQSFEYIFGNKEEATRLWTEVANEMWDVFAESGTRRNEILKAWHDAGGYDDMLEGIRNSWEVIKSITGAIKESFDGLFSGLDDKKLFNLTNRFKTVTAKIKENFVIPEAFQDFIESPKAGWLAKTNDTLLGRNILPGDVRRMERVQHNLDNIRDAFGGIRSIVELVKFSFSSFGKILSPLGKLFQRNSNGFLAFAGSIGRFVTKTVDAITQSKLLENVIDGMTKVVDGAVAVFKSLGENAKKVFNKLVESKAFQEITSKVKNLAFSFKETFGTTVQNGVSKITKFFGDLTEKFDADLLWERVKKVGFIFQELWGILGDLYTRVLNWISPVFSSLSDIFGDLKPNVDKVLDGISNFLQELRESDSPLSVVNKKLKEFGNWLSSIWNSIKTTKFKKLGFSSIWDYIVAGFNNVKERVTKTLNSIGETLSKLDWGKILTIALGMGFTIALFKFARALTSLRGLIDVFTGLGDSISKFFKKSALKQVAISVLIFAGAIAILTQALIALSKVNSRQLIKGGIALGALTVGLVALLGGLTVGLGILGKKGLLPGVKDAGIAMLAIAGSVAVLVVSLRMLSKLTSNPAALDTSIQVIIGLMIAITGMAALIGKASPALKGVGIGVLSMTVALFALFAFVKAVGKESTKKYAEKAQENFGLIISLFMTLVGLTALTRLAGKNGLSGGLGVLGLAVSLLVVYSAIKKLGALKNTVLVKGLISVILILSALAEFGRLIGRANKYSARGGVAIAIMAGSLLLIYSAVKKFGKLNSRELVRGLGAVSLVLLEYAGLIHVMKMGAFESGIKAGSILAMVLAVTALVASLSYLTLFSWGDLLKSTIFLSAVLLAFGGAMRLMGQAKLNSATITACILAIGALITTIIGIQNLSDIPWPQLVASAGSISAVLLALGGSLRLIQESGWNHYNKGSFAGFISGLAGIFVIGAILSYIAQQDFSWQNMAASAGGISATLIALSFAMKMTSKLPAGGSIYTGMVDLVGWLLGLIVILGILAYIAEEVHFSDAHVAQVERIGAMIGGFVGGIFGGLAGGLGLGMSIALPTMATNLSTFMTNLEPFLTAVSSIPDGFDSKMDALSTGLLKIGKAELKDAWANLINNIAGIAPSNDFGAKFARLGIALKMFDISLSGVDPVKLSGNIDNLTKILDVFHELPNKYPTWKENLLGSVVGYFVNAFEGQTDFTSFTSGMVALASGLQIFQRFTKGVSADAILEPIDCIAKLTEALGKIPKTGPIKDFLLGTAEWSTLSTGLAEMGKALVAFSNEVSGKNGDKLDAAAIDKAIDPATKLNTLLSSIPEVWGVVPLITGVSNWSTLSTGLVEFGEALVGFSDKVKGKSLDAQAINDAIEPSKKLAALLEVVPEAGGFLQKFTGEHEWKTLGEGLGEMGEALVGFSDIITGKIEGLNPVDSEKLTAVLTPMEGFFAMIKDFDVNSIGFEALSAKGGGLEKFGEGMSSMAGKIALIDTEAIDKVVASMNELAEIAKPESTIRTVGKDLAGSIVTDFYRELTSSKMDDPKNIGEGFLSRIKSSFAMLSVAGEDEVSKMAEFGQDFVGIIFDSISTTLNSEDVDFSSINGLAGQMITAINKALAEEDLSSIGVGIINTIGNTFLPGDAKGGPAMETAAGNLASMFSSWFDTQSGKADLQLAADAFSGGLIDGIEHNTSMAYSAGQVLASKAISGASSAKAPMITIGENVGNGFIIGISGKIAASYAAGVRLGMAAVTGAATASEVASPSKATYRIGSFVGEGLSLGMLSMTSKIEKSAEQMAGSSILSVASVFDTIDAALAGDLDLNPVITPVLDLSGISYGASQINGILNNEAAFKLAGELQAEQTTQDLSEMLLLGRAILKEIQNGSDLYFDDGVLAGRINRRLGSL